MKTPWWILLVLIIIIIVVLINTFVKSPEKEDEIVSDRAKELIKPLTHEVMLILNDTYTKLYEGQEKRIQEELKTFSIVLYDQSVAQSLAAISKIVTKDGVEKMVYTKLVQKGILLYSPEIYEYTIQYGRYLAYLNGVDLRTFGKDIPYDTPITNPELMISVALIFLNLTPIIVTEEPKKEIEK